MKMKKGGDDPGASSDMTLISSTILKGHSTEQKGKGREIKSPNGPF